MQLVTASFIVVKLPASKIIFRRPCSQFLTIVVMASFVLNLSACSAGRPSPMYEASRSFRKWSISDVNFSAVLPFWLVFAILALTASDVSPTIVSCNFFMIEFIVISFCTLYSVDPIIFDLMTSTAKSSNVPLLKLTNFKAVINL